VNNSELKNEIASRSGIPRSVIAQVLDIQDQIIQECVLNRETCYIGSTFIINSRFRDYNIIDGTGNRTTVTRLAVNVKPRAPFRQRMNNGKIRRTN
jgi:hypothetical protein